MANIVERVVLYVLLSYENGTPSQGVWNLKFMMSNFKFSFLVPKSRSGEGASEVVI